MLSNRMKKPRGCVAHKHYRYQGLFNNIFLETKQSTYDPQQQETTIHEQEQRIKDQKTFPNGYEYLIHYSENFCVYFITTTNYKRPSEATAARNFTVLEFPMDRVLGSPSSSTTKIYVKDSKIKEIFTADIVSFLSFDDCLQEIESKVDETLQNLGTSKNTEQAISSILGLRSSVQKAKSYGLQNKRAINYELPYSQWLYELTKAELTPLGFVVNHEYTGKPIAPTNEYIFGKRDLVIYHAMKSEKKIEALHVGIAPFDILSAEESHYTVNSFELLQGLAELKVKAVDAKAENEAFYNMFAEVIKLMMKSLAAGNIITKATVFGIVVATHEHQYATLLKIEFNFDDGCCFFYKCPDSTDFANLFNGIIGILHH